MRNSNREIEEEGEKRLAIPITVRQLEAIVRISESLAKMELKPFATDAHVDEAIRIFQVGIQILRGISGLFNDFIPRCPHCRQPSPGTCPAPRGSRRRRTRRCSTGSRSS